MQAEFSQEARHYNVFMFCLQGLVTSNGSSTVFDEATLRAVLWKDLTQQRFMLPVTNPPVQYRVNLILLVITCHDYTTPVHR